MTESADAQRLLDTTGDPAVDGLVQRLGELDGRPADEQVEVFSEIHAGLVQVLRVGDSEQAAITEG